MPSETVRMAQLRERIGFLWTRYREFVVYCLIGGSGVTLDCLVFAGLTIGLGWHYQLANAISVSCGIQANGPPVVALPLLL